ncbi:MAG TPA: HAD-IA family hydrolase [Candidatus Saccharimonadales bacterium]|nr:HAD-IA family hydrolase [Candidatus Saccharimonadales bacterium]
MAAIIFDFDGTIADSFPYVTAYLARQANIELTSERQAELHGLSMAAIARSLGIAWWRLPRIFVSGRRAMEQSMQDLKPIEGMADVLRKLHAEGHELFILSTNTVRNVHKFLHHHDLHELFLEIYGGVGIFGKSPALRRLLREQSFDRNQGVYVGDELRDVEAAQAINLPVIAVTWGFARTSDLADREPDGLAETPEQLLKLLEER